MTCTPKPFYKVTTSKLSFLSFLGFRVGHRTACQKLKNLKEEHTSISFESNPARA
jgi:hypothetical protein